MSADNITWHSAKAQDTDRQRVCGQRGMIIWLTGLSGSGKSTIAVEAEKRLLDMDINAYVLDGDNLRHGLNNNLGFTKADRDENIRRIAETAALMAKAGVVVLVSAISPFREMRQKARVIAGQSPFIEVYVKADVQTCAGRDPKGLYKKALAGKIPEFTGVSSPYEEPENPELVLDTVSTSLSECVRTLIYDAVARQSEFFYKKVVEYCILASLKAGAAIMEVYSGDFGVEYKSDKSPLTVADKASDGIINKALKEKYPLFPVLSEESADDRSRLLRDYCFIVDPLDGTKEFVKRNGEFTVNIGLSYKGMSVAGVVYAPANGLLYYAAHGIGSFAFDTSKGQLVPFDEDTRIHVSQRRDALVVMQSRSHSDEAHKSFLERNSAKIGSIISSGSSLKGCMIATGEADVYYRPGPTMEWDTCAMQAVVEQAGGLLMQLDDSPLTYNRENSLNDKGFYILNSIENKFDK